MALLCGEQHKEGRVRWRLLNCMSRNNTDLSCHRKKDWGKTWSDAKVISEQVLSPAWYKGGPSSEPSYDGGFGWVATTGSTQLTVGKHKGRLLVSGDRTDRGSNTGPATGPTGKGMRIVLSVPQGRA